MIRLYLLSLFFFFNDTATTEIYTLSLHDALPISENIFRKRRELTVGISPFHLHLTEHCRPKSSKKSKSFKRSEEHTSELQSHSDLVCRLLLEKKKKKK